MRILAALIALLILASPLHAQCTVPGCDAATAVVANGRATGAAILTAVAPPTRTPVPPTPQPEPTPLPEPTPIPTPAVIVVTVEVREMATVQPSATSATTATMVASATATTSTRSRVGDDLLIVGLIVGLIVAGGALYLWWAWRKGWIRCQ